MSTTTRPHKSSGSMPISSPKKTRSVGRTPFQGLTDAGSNTTNLPDTECRKHSTWERPENAALVEYVALHHAVIEGKEWPTTQDKTFWTDCAEFVAKKTGKPVRTHSACRSCMNRLRRKHTTLHQAEEYIRYTDLGQKENNPAGPTTPKTPADSLADIQSEFHNLTQAQQWDCLDNLYRQMLDSTRPSLPSFVPCNFLKLSAAAMDTLHTNKRENTLYHLVSALGTPREDGCGPLMPLDRMPFPLIEYNAKIFCAENPDLPRCSSEHIAYMETMYVHFGNNIHNSPLWHGGTEEDEGENQKAEKRNLMEPPDCKQVDLSKRRKERKTVLEEAMHFSKELKKSLLTPDVKPLPVGDQPPAETSTSSSVPWLEHENQEQDS
ncbi:uncharacterized protein LOC144870357 [Branchiostoma floridae x Branchiostoma japonicum]